MPKYAQGTTVAVQRSREEIEATLKRYGASGFAFATEELRAAISFRHQGKVYRLDLRLPPESSFATYVRKGKYGDNRARRTPAQARTAWEQEERRLWRSLAMAVKSKLEIVASGIATFEEEWLSYAVTPDGRTVGRVLVPELDRALQEGKLPALMSGRSER